ncbi:MAG TPA: NAD(P)/FAD-dependent oxidoreductase [Candidatus Nitrosotalea sp.]|nr:NAD(P)/FAD-dependent oxidoreductase [Candidatus Nitrosotalea sp.]
MSEAGSSERFDVVVVGARCAGSPLATFLKRAGLNVCVVDQTDFPSDTLSTHMFQIGGIEVLHKLGVLEKVLATGAPPITNCHMKFEDVDMSGPPRVRKNDLNVPLLCVRRVALDIRLVEMAQEAGVEMRLNTRVVELLKENGRVNGVRVARRDGKTSTIHADLVVGADGRLSTVARLTGSRRYHVVPSERMSSWAYFRGVPRQPVAKIYYHRRGDDFVVAAPADDDLFIVAVCPSVEYFDDYRADSEASFRRAVSGCEPVAELLANAERTTKFRGLTRFEGFFREATGPGWVLVGDSGHFKDPTPGQGISDALRQVEKLSQAIIRGFGNPAQLDEALRGWASWRDRDAIQHYWFCSDIGKRGPIDPVRLEILRSMAGSDEMRMDFLDIFLHRRYPRQMFGPRALLSATARMLSDPAKRPGALDGTLRLMREDVSRRMQALRPRLTGRAMVDEPHFDHQPTTA